MGGTLTRTELDESFASTKDQLDEATDVALLQSTKSAPASSPRRSRSATIFDSLGFTNNLRVSRARSFRIARVHEQTSGFPKPELEIFVENHRGNLSTSKQEPISVPHKVNPCSGATKDDNHTSHFQQLFRTKITARSTVCLGLWSSKSEIGTKKSGAERLSTSYAPTAME